MNAVNRLLDSYAVFYTEVIRLKSAIESQKLASCLDNGKRSDPLTEKDFAPVVSSRLNTRLLELRRDVERNGTQPEIQVSQIGLYVMAAQADELFLLEWDWPGKEAWQNHLLEEALFNSSTAGRDFFVYLKQLLESRAREPLHEQLATVFLVALQLGFKGKYRVEHADAGAGRDEALGLQTERDKLIRFAGLGHESEARTPAFNQAYLYTEQGEPDQRAAAPGRWRRFWWIALIAYLLASTAVWQHAAERYRVQNEDRTASVYWCIDDGCIESTRSGRA